MLFPSFMRGITNIENVWTGEYKILVVFAKIKEGPGGET